jgi:hypothetical protein
MTLGLRQGVIDYDWLRDARRCLSPSLHCDGSQKGHILFQYLISAQAFRQMKYLFANRYLGPGTETSGDFFALDLSGLRLKKRLGSAQFRLSAGKQRGRAPTGISIPL